MIQMEIKCLQNLIILLKNSQFIPQAEDLWVFLVIDKYNIKIEDEFRLESCLKIGYTSGV
jgi:hypothetical protein